MQFFKFLPPINLPWCRMRSHKKIGHNRFSRLTNTEGQPDNPLAKYINGWNDVDYVDYIDDVDYVDRVSKTPVF